MLIQKPGFPLLGAVAVDMTLENRPVPTVFTNKNIAGNYALSYDRIIAAPMWVAAACSSAAPTFFPPVKYEDRTFIDGGIGYNNPVPIAFHEALTVFPGKGIKSIVSMGTGEPSYDFADITPSPLSTLQTIVKVKDILTDSIVTSAKFAEDLSIRCPSLYPYYFRLNPHGLGKPHYSLDDYRPDRVGKMKHLAKTYVRNNKATFVKVVAALLK